MKKFLSIFMLLALLSSCAWNQEVIKETIKPKYINSIVAENKSFKEDLKLIWKVSSQKETSISPLSSWVIKTINVDIWTKVNKWDTLATIDTNSNLVSLNLNNALNTYQNTQNVFNASKETLQKNLENAKLQLQNATISRENIYNSTQKQLEIAQVWFSWVNTQKENIKNSTNTTLELNKESLKWAELNLENFEKNYIQNINWLNSKKDSIIDNIKISIDSAFTNIDNSLIYIDTIMWITNKNKNLNDSYEIYLSAKDTSYKTNVERLFQESNNLFDELKSSYDKNFDEKQLNDFYKKLINLNDKMVLTYDNFSQVLENTVTSSSLDFNQLNSYKTALKTYQLQMISLKSTLTWLSNWLVDINNTITSTTTNLETQRNSLNQAIKIAKATLENTIAATNSSIDNISSTQDSTSLQLKNTIETIDSSRKSADNALKIAQNSYDAALANYNSQLAWLKTQLDSAWWQKDSLQKQVENSIIKAPYDWVIVWKNIEIWQTVSSQSQAFIISNSWVKVVKLDLSWDNIRYLNNWDEVKIQKNSETFTWTISTIWTSPDKNSKLYPVEIIFSNLENNLIVWDFVDVFIQKEINDTNIVIPFSSIIVWANENYNVYVIWSWSLVEERNVKLWESNSSEVVVLNWLNIWDRVIINWSLNVSPWDLVEEIK